MSLKTQLQQAKQAHMGVLDGPLINSIDYDYKRQSRITLVETAACRVTVHSQQHRCESKRSTHDNHKLQLNVD